MSVLESVVDGTQRRCVMECLTYVTRLVSDLAAAETFYCDALGFRRLRSGEFEGGIDFPLDPAWGAAARQVVLQLGTETLALVQPSPAASTYPADSRSNDLWFQHLAIVVSDMDRAYAHLCARPGWRAISTGGPQRLPASSGGVRAFKFRDPDGHPLELLWFPANQGRAQWRQRQNASSVFLGIDHTALSISETRRSLRFYAALGWTIRYRSLNRGTRQASLDGLDGARVRVLGLRAASSTGPGIELLAYRPPGRGAAPLAPANPFVPPSSCSLADDRTALAGPASIGPAAIGPQTLSDPDGHRLVVCDQPTCADASTTNPKPPTRPKFFRNSQKCSSPSPSSNRQNPGKRQN
jgi:catechol 2,3-dioxygenase-like lactoylglutathione lyase family enzyme